MTHNIPGKSISFLKENQLATICFVDENHKPYCINCFYVFDELSECLIMKSTNGTQHQTMTIESNDVSGTILPETIDLIKLKGIQFSGNIISNHDIDKFKMKTKYLKKFPISIAMSGYIWAVKLEFIKHTDNTLGFGHKTIWTK